MLDIKNAQLKLFNETDSTNTQALNLLKSKNGNCEPTWFRANIQTHGRGRNKSTWISEKGNLFITLLTPMIWPVNIIPMLSCVVAVTIHESIKSFLPDGDLLKIKWPNDILYKNSKISGILIENQINGDSKYSIIGIGVNIFSSPSNLEYSTICLGNLAPNSKELLEQFFIKLKERLHKNLNLFNENSVSYFLEYALSNLWNLNKDVEFNNSGSIHKGKLIGLSNNYEIILDIDRKNRTFNSGEISIRK